MTQNEHRKPKILVAYDGSECSEKALHDLRRAGMPAEAEAVVLNVADAWVDKGGPVYDFSTYATYVPLVNIEIDWIKAALKEARGVARKGVDGLKRYFPNWEIHAESEAEIPVWGIIHKIESWNPDLIVMGSHGRSAGGRLLFGSVSHKVLTHVHGNLRVARGRAEHEKEIPPLRIAVAFDGSQESETAFQSAICRDWPKGTAIKLITVVDLRLSLAFFDPTGPMRYWVKQNDRDPLAWVERMQADQKMRIEEKGLLAYTEILRGDPKRLLLKEAEDWGADTLFVGPRGLSARQGILAGSVSTAVAMHAHCSVEVVHRLWGSSICCGQAGQEHRECMIKEGAWDY